MDPRLREGGGLESPPHDGTAGGHVGPPLRKARAMVIVSGLMRAGTTWVARMLAEEGQVPVVQEPTNPEAARHGDETFVPTQSYMRALSRTRALTHRHPGHNEELSAEDRAEVRSVYRWTRGQCWGAGVIKLMHLLYWDIIRETWPEARLVYVERRLTSWLSAVARTNWDGTEIAHGISFRGWDYIQDAPWERMARGMCGEEDRLLPLFEAACYWRVLTGFRREVINREWGSDWLSVDYEALTASYCTEMPRLFGYCGIQGVTALRQRVLAEPPMRGWYACAWSWEDVVEVAGRVGERERR